MFISFEGTEGAGKSTALLALAKSLAAYGYGEEKLVCTREPGGSALGRELRATLLNTQTHDLCPEAELLLFTADRAQHVHSLIRPALAAGKIVLCDRYMDSTLAYQGGGRGHNKEKLLQLHTIATQNLWPDITFFFDVPVEVGLARAHARNTAENTAETEGRFDAESLAFHTRVYNVYKELIAEYPQRFYAIDATQTSEVLVAQCLERILERLSENHSLVPCKV